MIRWLILYKQLKRVFFKLAVIIINILSSNAVRNLWQGAVSTALFFHSISSILSGARAHSSAVGRQKYHQNNVVIINSCLMCFDILYPNKHRCSAKRKLQRKYQHRCCGFSCKKRATKCTFFAMDSRVVINCYNDDLMMITVKWSFPMII